MFDFFKQIEKETQSWKGNRGYLITEIHKLELALEGLLDLTERLKLLYEVNTNDAEVILAAKKVLAESRGG